MKLFSYHQIFRMAKSIKDSYLCIRGIPTSLKQSTDMRKAAKCSCKYMLKSMTGYGKAQATLEGGRLTIEFRSLNGKNADINIKSSLIPKDKELLVRKKIVGKLQRGSIDMMLNWESDEADNAKQINEDLALGYCSQLKNLSHRLGLKDYELDSTGLLSLLLGLPEVISYKKSELITEDNWPVVEAAIDEALEALDQFRIKEGKVLQEDVTAKVNNILSFVNEEEKYEVERTPAIREKILARFDELKLAVDKDRLEQEMIFYIEKLDINEEKVRLRQHCRYFIETMQNEECPGKKLGFIAQEMGREINTTGSKANHNEIQKIVVRMKDELEKIKEQSLNIL